MSDPTATPARVPVLAPDPKTGKLRPATVDAADAEAIVNIGGHVVTPQEAKEAELRQQYEAAPTINKVAGYASTVLPFSAQNALSATGVAPIKSGVEAFNSGVSSAATLGLDEVGTKAALDAVAGPEAGRAYGKHILDAREANPGYHTAGQVVGFAAMTAGGGGLGGAAKAVPGLGVSALGGAAESAVSSVLAPVARGAIGRALATGGSLAARGTVEGALYGGANQITEDYLGDHELAADKIFAASGTGALYGAGGGAVLGAGGSLLASGGRATFGGISKALATRGEAATSSAARGADVAEAGASKALTAADAVPARLGTEGAEVAEAAGLKPAKEASSLRKALSGDVDGATRDTANTLAFDALGTTRKVADKINEKVPGGTKAVGDYVNRRILPQADQDVGLLRGAYNAARSGRADDLLPVIQAQKAIDGAAIGDLVRATPVRVSEADLLAKAGSIAHEMASDPTKIQGAKAFTDQVSLSLDALRNGGKLVGEPGAATVDLADMYYARANMERVAHEMKRGNSAAGEGMKEWLREVDAHLVEKVDEAARAIGDTGAKEKLLGLKREYQLGASAEKAAEDGVKRIAGNNSIGLREGVGLAVGAATGHLLPALAVGVGGKMLRERGSAAGAYLLTKMADMGTLSRAIKAVDEQVGKAAKGMLSAPASRALPEPSSTVPLRSRATSILAKYAAIQADPEKYATTVADHTAALNNSAPNLAGALTQRLTSAAAFMSTKVPVHADPDPFDPHAAPHMTDAEAATLVRYDSYVERPMRFFEEAERGKLTHEGAEVARALMPGLFAEMQQRTMEGLAALMAQGKRPPFAQRERLGIILDAPATPSQRPDHMGFLQANVTTSGKAPQPATPKRPMATKSQPSTLDRLEGK